MGGTGQLGPAHRPHLEIENVTDADVQAFWCSLVGRRFPRLQQLKSSRVKELIVAQRKQAGCVLQARCPSYPKSRHQNVTQVVYFGHGSKNLHDIAGAEKPRKQVGLRVVSVPLDSKRPVQRENPDWQWCGHACVGQLAWRPSGKHCSRADARRHGKQRFIQDMENFSEYSRAHDFYYGLELEAKRNWLAGDLKTPNRHRAKETLATKATLYSPDDYHKKQELLHAKQRGRTNLQAFKEEYKASRAASRTGA